MRHDWDVHLSRWTEAGVVDAATAERIRSWEAKQAGPQGLSWPTRIALAFGALLICAGVLLFVSAHWDELSPGQRMALVLSMVAVFHAGGAYAAGRFELLSMALHTIGTITLGAGIALAGQIFNISEHWPSAVLMWAVGAAAAWALLGHWTQGALTAILLPAWLVSEWTVHVQQAHSYYVLPVFVGLCGLSFAYLGARRGAADRPLRRALGWIGGLALLPAAAPLAVNVAKPPADGDVAVAWIIAVLAPLIVAGCLRGRGAIWIAGFVAWSALTGLESLKHEGSVPVYLLYAIGSLGLAAWGMREFRVERVNLGIAGFAITVAVFTFHR
jgi:uncharacterized membrane protein